MRLHGRAVESYLAGTEHDRTEREDLWAEVFATAFQRIDVVASLAPAQERAWLIRTARYLTSNSARRSINRRSFTLRLGCTQALLAPSAEDEFVEASAEIEDQRIAAAWCCLTASHREVLLLDSLGYEGPAMANELRISAAAARSGLMRARRAFLASYSPNEQPTR